MNLLKYILLLFVFLPATAMSATMYTDQTSYLTALSAGGYTIIHEGFEDDVTWAASRSTISSPATTPFVISQGIKWTSNYGTNEVSTGGLGGSVIDGSYGFYSIPHGNQETTQTLACANAEEPDIPDYCWQEDGWIGTSVGAGTLYGVGGWIDGTFGAKVTILLDGVNFEEDPANRDGTRVGDWTFVGIIEPAGFTTFEVRELGGKGGQNELIFGDAFTIGATFSALVDIIYVDSGGICGGKAPCVDSINLGIAQSADVATINIAEGLYNGDITLGKSKDLILLGGWDAAFTSQTSYTTANGLIIRQGKIITYNLILRSLIEAGSGGPDR